MCKRHSSILRLLALLLVFLDVGMHVASGPTTVASGAGPQRGNASLIVTELGRAKLKSGQMSVTTGALPTAGLGQDATDIPEQSAPGFSLSVTRQLIRRWLATPDNALLTFTVGLLLVFVECNLPGIVVPGVTGLLLVLAASYGLASLPLRPAALVLIISAGCVLAVSAKVPAKGLSAALGTAGLTYGLWHLIAWTASRPRVHPVVAISAGLTLGVAGSLLGRVAELARQNKRTQRGIGRIGSAVPVGGPE